MSVTVNCWRNGLESVRVEADASPANTAANSNQGTSFMTDRSESSAVVRRLILSQILIVLVLLVRGSVYWKLYQGRTEVEQKEIEPVLLNVDVFECSAVDFQEVPTGFGTVRADREVILSAQ